MGILGTSRVFSQKHISLEFLLAHSFTEDQTVSDSDRFIGIYIVKINILSIATPRDFLLIRVNEDNKINYVDKPTKLTVDQLTHEELVIFRDYLRYHPGIC